jgi:hypothetical protein
MSECNSPDRIENLKKLFKQLAELINKYTNLVAHSNFIFVPGLEDPCTSYVVPRWDSVTSFLLLRTIFQATHTSLCDRGYD